MAVREFTAAGSDQVNFSIGNIAGLTYGTLAWIIRRINSGQTARAIAIRTAAGADTIVAGVSTGNGFEGNYGGTGAGATGGPTIGTEWWLMVWRKPAGTVTSRIHFYNFSTTTWTHANFNNGTARADLGTAVASDATVRQRDQFGAFSNQRIAVTGVWKNSDPWTSDGAVEGAGLHTALSNWASSSPAALWAWNQASTATAITDLTGGGANQTSITGTSVATGDDPPGFDFSLGASAPPFRRLNYGALLQV